MQNSLSRYLLAELFLIAAVECLSLRVLVKTGWIWQNGLDAQALPRSA